MDEPLSVRPRRRVITEVGSAVMVGGNIRGYTRTLTTAITKAAKKMPTGYSLGKKGEVRKKG